MIDLDHATLDRVLPSTPGAADWGDVMSRSRVHDGRRRRLVVLAAVALLLVATASAFGVRALVLDNGFLGAPPEGATPSTPESGELVLSYWGRPPAPPGPDQPQPWYRVRVYADGRLIWDREGSFPFGATKGQTGPLEQRLTPEGVELLRSEALSTGLFGRDAHQAGCIRHPWCAGLVVYTSFTWGQMTVRQHGQLVNLRWETPDIALAFPDVDRSGFRDATPEDVAALERLTARLRNLESWLPASAWQDRQIRAYVPSRMAVCASGLPHANSFPPLPNRAKELLANADAHDGMGFMANADDTCYAVTPADARAIADALEDAGVPRVDPDVPQAAYRVEDGIINFFPILPDGEVICQACG